MACKKTTPQPNTEWLRECYKWRGRILRGEHAHYCFEWDGLPVDETCPEWPCGCEGQTDA